MSIKEERVIMILVNWRNQGRLFSVNVVDLGACISCQVSIVYIANVTKFARVEGGTLSNGKLNNRKKSLDKIKRKRKTTGPKKKEIAHFCIQEKKDLSKSCICLPKMSVR